MCILAIIVMEGYMLTVCGTKMDKVKPWKPKDGDDNCIGGNRGWGWILLSYPWYCSLIVKRRGSYDQNNQKWWFGKKWWQSWTWNKLECSVIFSRLRWGKTCKAVLKRTIHSQVLQLNQIVSICLQETVLPWNTKYLYKWLSPYFLSLLHANDVSSENLQRLYSCPFHVWDIGFCTWPSRIPLPGCFSMDACTAICLKSCYQAAWWENKCHLKVRRQTSSLVFIFIFYISLNVQRVSCSTVKYLYIHMYLYWFDLFGSTDFSSLSCSSIIECSYYAFLEHN